MKVFLTRDKGTLSEDDVFLVAVKEDVEIDDLVNKNRNELIKRGYYKSEVEDVVEFTRDRGVSAEFLSVTDFLTKEELQNFPKGCAMEFISGETIKEFCDSLCPYGNGSDVCKSCPLRGCETPIKIFKDPEI
jgi:hypothetical protein